MYSVHDELFLTFALDENNTFWLTGVWDFYLCVQGGIWSTQVGEQ